MLEGLDSVLQRISQIQKKISKVGSLPFKHRKKFSKVLDTKTKKVSNKDTEMKGC